MTCPWCISEGDLFLGGKCPKCFRKEKDMNKTAALIYKACEEKICFMDALFDQGVFYVKRTDVYKIIKEVCESVEADQAQSTAQPAPTEMTASEIKAAIDRILMLFDNSHKDHSHREFAYIQDYKSLIKKDLESLLTQPKEGE
jgi:hypothetical protein